MEREDFIEYLANSASAIFDHNQTKKLIDYFLSIYGLYKMRGVTMSADKIYRYIIRSVKLPYRQQVILYSIFSDYSMLTHEEKGKFLYVLIEKMIDKLLEGADEADNKPRIF
ncbi:hypothetical protein AZ270_gp20 [Acidianus tailed spindle virus]|uniref:hypothetical protein n=1 Tax=Acidianus tailed spindle virus TaxID=1797140 RepID=UPI00076F300A|nr:hypothetical protein AZ270_gp20 [Acidianus tailed spindle virus]AME30043.1 hypothetical protein ATSV_C111 [Acidianus tailed spindle virus]